MSRFSRRSSSLESTASSSYELDLPPIPHPHLQQKGGKYLSWGPASSDLDISSPIYTNVTHPAFPVWGEEEEEEEGSGGGAGDVGKQAQALSTIMEQKATGSENEADEYMEDTISFKKGNNYATTSAAMATPNHSTSPPGRLLEQKEDENKYSPLRQSLLNPDNIYTAPSFVESSNKDLQQSSQRLLLSRDYNTDTQHSHHKSHASEYTALPVAATGVQSHGSNNVASNSNKSSSSNNPSKKRTLPWLRPTWRRSYMRMQMVRHMDTKCCMHPGFKKFCSIVITVLCILLLAVGAVVLSVVSWHILREEDLMLSSMVESQIGAIASCRVGRNWTSVEVSESIAHHTLTANDDNPIDVNVNNIGTQGSRHQMLLYIVLQSYSNYNNNNNNNNNNSNSNDSCCCGCNICDHMDASTFLNIVMWTSLNNDSKSEQRAQFRENMAILGHSCYPQIVSRSIWFPLKNTSLHFYARADVMGGGGGGGKVGESSTHSVNMTIYLSGYC